MFTTSQLTPTTHRTRWRFDPNFRDLRVGAGRSPKAGRPQNAAGPANKQHSRAGAHVVTKTSPAFLASLETCPKADSRIGVICAQNCAPLRPNASVYAHNSIEFVPPSTSKTPENTVLPQAPAKLIRRISCHFPDFSRAHKIQVHPITRRHSPDSAASCFAAFFASLRLCVRSFPLACNRQRTTNNGPTKNPHLEGGGSCSTNHAPVRFKSHGPMLGGLLAKKSLGPRFV
jgi:hypothetical protein